MSPVVRSLLHSLVLLITTFQVFHLNLYLPLVSIPISSVGLRWAVAKAVLSHPLIKKVKLISELCMSLLPLDASPKDREQSKFKVLSIEVFCDLSLTV